MNADTPARSARKPSPPRRRAREFVVQGLYQHWVGGQDEAAILAQAQGVIGFAQCDQQLYHTLLRESLSQQEVLRTLLLPHLDRPWEKVSPVERSILLLGACELYAHSETPCRVVMNEAIDLAKTFGGTDGHRFVNGVLDKLAAALRPDEAGSVRPSPQCLPSSS